MTWRANLSGAVLNPPLHAGRHRHGHHANPTWKVFMSARPSAAKAPRGRSVQWLLLTIVVSGLTALLPLVWNTKHYFVDDSVNGAFGQWYHLGTSLLDGWVPLLEPTAWSSGNLMAEGQWGFFNPLVILISLASTAIADAAVFTTVVKVIAIVLGSLGVFLLARELGARPQLAFLAASAAPFTGFTTYFDAPSWVTGLFAWSLVPYYWALLLRLCRGYSPLPTFVLGYLVISIGYVHGTIALAMVTATTLILQVIRRRPGPALRVLAAGALLGLVAVGIHLSSVLTAPVTNRGGNAIYMDQFMTVDLSGMAMSPVSTALPQVAAWWWVGFTAPIPMTYITCLVPLAAFVSWRRLGRVLPRMIDLVVLLGVLLVFIMLPTVVGPLRYPTRLLPYLALCVILLIALGLDRALTVTRARVIVASALLASASFLAWAQTPQHLKRLAFAAALTAVAIVIVVVIARVRRRDGERRRMLLAGGLVVVSVAAFGFQQWAYPRSIWAEQQIPTAVADLQTQLADSEGDTIVVGDPLAVDPSPELWSETLFANSWYVNPNSVVNRYQLLGYRGFNDRLCLGYLGETCPDLATRLFETRAATGLTLADELAISSVQIIRSEETEDVLDDPPAGWHVADDSEYTQLWVRDEPVEGAGGLVHSSAGVEATELSSDETSARLEVSNASDGAGVLVFSRLSWPGYSTSAGTIIDPTDGFLLTVEVPAGFDGELSIDFRPAGLNATIILLAASTVIALAWSLVLIVRRRPRGVKSRSSD